MTDIELPVIAEDVSQEDGLRLMGSAGAGAVEMPDGFRIVTSQMIIETPEAVDVGHLADRCGVPLGETFNIITISDHGHVRFDPDRILPQFDVPAGYKQCPDNGNHTYALDSPYALCPADDAVLMVVYLNE